LSITRQKPSKKSSKFVRIKDLFTDGVRRLEKAGITDPELEISLLLAHQLNINRTKLLLSGDQELNAAQLERLENNLLRRTAREPLAYIIGEKEFWSLPFRVSRDVLIPRPETELLIERALSTISKYSENEARSMRILDLGTGSGAIAVVMALELSAASVTAVDISYKALKVARHNAKRHRVDNKVQFVNSNWGAGISTDSKYDLILANPPYIAEKNLDGSTGGAGDSLQPEVSAYEPRQALDGGEKGMQSILNIAEGMVMFLNHGGWLFMEIGADQKVEVIEIFKKSGHYVNVAVFDDYAGLPRILQARRK
jgi:release factor glutamine methyltransferase